MGQVQTNHVISDARIESILSGLVMFTPTEIRDLYKRFHTLCDRYYRQYPDSSRILEDAVRFLPMSAIMDIPELKYNPFRYRIGRLFGEVDPNAPYIDHTGDIAAIRVLMQTPDARIPSRPGEGPQGRTCRAEARRLMITVANDINGLRCSFETFVEMLGVFSIRAPPTLKSKVAFSLYDFDGDDFIGHLDVDCALAILSEGQDNGFNEDEIVSVSNAIVAQMDLDGNGMLSELEFTRLLRKTPTFSERFAFDIVGV